MDHINCVNCGAPPALRSPFCRYCGSALDQVVPQANLAGYKHLKKALLSFSFDSESLKAVRAVRGPFTAGQVIQILGLFAFDSTRLQAAEYLVPRSLKEGSLLRAAELFSFDSDRAKFVLLCSRYLEPSAIDDDDDDDADYIDDDDDPNTEAVPGGFFPWGFVGVALVLALALAWMR